MTIMGATRRKMSDLEQLQAVARADTIIHMLKRAIAVIANQISRGSAAFIQTSYINNLAAACNRK